LNARAVARPIPAPEAVQKAVLPARRMILSLIPFSGSQADGGRVGKGKLTC
jgi:hypothetical protein